jgi:nitrate reductase NapE component
MAALVQLWSVIIRIESKPSDLGRSTMRSMAMFSNGALFHSVAMGKVGIFGFVVWLVVD